MGDLARDPVFGAVARALQPAAAALPRPAAAVRVAPAATRWLEVTFATAGLGREARRRLDAATPRLSTVPVGRGREQLGCPRFALADLGMDQAEVAALLHADDLARRDPGPVRVMGVVNVTPDSFSDGGRFLDPARAVEHGLRLVAEGADLLDVGGESTRPGSEPVPEADEIARVVPVIAGLARQARVPISVDTTKSAVARAALDAGATIVNDVSAGRADDALLPLVAEHGAGFVAMHMQGTPRSMQAAPTYDDVVTEVTEFLRERCFRALEAGVDRQKLWIDPGIGFGKTLEHNLELLRRLGELRSLGLPVVLGVSRKAFIPKITGRDTPPAERLGGTAAAVAFGVLGGAEILRVHDVAVMREAALVARALAVRP